MPKISPEELQQWMYDNYYTFTSNCEDIEGCDYEYIKNERYIYSEKYNLYYDMSDRFRYNLKDMLIKYHYDLDLSNLDLSGMKFSRINFQDINLENVNLSRAWIEYCNFEGVNLKNSNIKDAQLLISIFKKANLQNCDLTSTRILSIDFTNANLEDAILNNCDTSSNPLTDDFPEFQDTIRTAILTGVESNMEYIRNLQAEQLKNKNDEVRITINDLSWTDRIENEAKNNRSTNTCIIS